MNNFNKHRKLNGAVPFTFLQGVRTSCLSLFKLLKQLNSCRDMHIKFI